jgi:hypothetical protein
MSEEKKTYYERNKEKCLAQAREYQKAHVQEYKDYWKVYYQENKDKLREQRKEYYRLHPRKKPSKPRPYRPKKPTGNPIGRPRKPESEKKVRLPKVKEIKIEPPSPPPEPEEPPLVIEHGPVVVSFR